MTPKAKETCVTLAQRKGPNQDKITVVTCYDYTFARWIDDLVDAVLVGDSLGMVLGGEATTLGVTVEQVAYHCRAVSRGLKHAHLIADMPFLSYQVNAEEALRNAGRLLTEGHAESVKLEGGEVIAPTIERLVQAGIPVMGHLGLTPQSVHAMGGYKVQGRDEAARERIKADAIAVQQAGAFALVLEGIPTALAAEITAQLTIPTIGIGAGKHCDGQVLVLHDLLGLNLDFKPKFVKAFGQVGDAVRQAVTRYGSEVRSGEFPDEGHSFS